MWGVMGTRPERGGGGGLRIGLARGVAPSIMAIPHPLPLQVGNTHRNMGIAHDNRARYNCMVVWPAKHQLHANLLYHS